jgi:hypothetical protein
LVVPKGNRKLAMSATLVVSVITFLASGRFIQSKQQIRESASEQGPTFRPGIEDFQLTFGSNTFVYSASALRQHSAAPLDLGSTKPITLYAEADKLYADVTLYGGADRPPVEIKHNAFIVRPPGWDANSDQDALEVVDLQLHPVFQMTYVSQQHIVINGYFPFPGGFIAATDSGMIINPTGSIPPLTRIFRYPSWKYPGQRTSR